MGRTAPPVDLAGMMFRLHEALDGSGLPHAFGGALALAWCIPEPRATADIDLNIFVPVSSLDQLLAALPADIEVSPQARSRFEEDGQARLWWSGVPVDVFLSTDEFHADVGGRIVLRPFLGEELPFLACRDLAVFKAFFDRAKDWIDLENMAGAGSFEISDVATVLRDHLGPHDHRIGRLEAIQGNVNAGGKSAG